jgi:hypothetical protein
VVRNDTLCHTQHPDREVRAVEEKKSIEIRGMLGLVGILLFLPWSIYWVLYVPSTGKGGLLLALVATLMPLIWDRSHRIIQSVWIATLFIVFFVEYKAIDKDRADFAEQQRLARKEESDNFGKLLDQEKDNLRQILNTQDTNVKDILKVERQNFKDTINASNKTQAVERASFAALLRKQEELLTREVELYEFSAGKMLPANDPVPTTCDPLRVNDFLVSMGDVTWDTNTFPFIILKVGDRDVIKLDKSDSGAILISIDIRTKDGTTVARIDKNRSIINPSTGLVMWRDKNTLVLEDQHGTELLNARYLNGKSFRISGSIFTGGTMTMFHGCFRVSGAGVGIRMN